MNYKVIQILFIFIKQFTRIYQRIRFSVWLSWLWRQKHTCIQRKHHLGVDKVESCNPVGYPHPHPSGFGSRNSWTRRALTLIDPCRLSRIICIYRKYIETLNCFVIHFRLVVSSFFYQMTNGTFEVRLIKKKVKRQEENNMTSYVNGGRIMMFVWSYSRVDHMELSDCYVYMITVEWCWSDTLDLWILKISL
jgi:hypothetical protein